MSNLKRPLTKNFCSLTGQEPILNNFSLYNNFPIGLMIISKIDSTSCKDDKDSDEESEIEVKIKFINQQASELFEIKENDCTEKIHEQFQKFKKYDKSQVTEKTLDNILFNSQRENEYYGSFKNQTSLIYVKYKLNNEDLYLCTDYYSDERKVIQNQLFQSLKFQYIATLFHELYNPINALLIMIDNNKNEQENIKDMSISNLGNKINFSEIEESNFSRITENDYDEINSNILDEENNSNSFKSNKKINELYKRKLFDLNDKEKDISLLVNMIYIFLQNLILYLRINLGVNLKVNEINQNEENIKENEENKKNNNRNNEGEIEKIENIYSDNYLSLNNKNKKLNLEFSFNKHLDKFSYLFNFKNIRYCRDFSYLSDKYILTDEIIFFDFLGQIYSFLYYIVPKSKGFELSYSIINENKLKILFAKANCPKTLGYRFKKSKKNNTFLIGEDKFKATSTVKTSEMTQEILYKLSEILGIKIKIMEYEDQKEDIFFSIILPFFIDEENDLLDSEIDELSETNFGKIPYLEEVFRRNVLSSKEEEQELEENKNPKNNTKVNNLNAKPFTNYKNINKKNKNVNYLNPNFYKFNPDRRASFLIDEVEEKNSSEEDASQKDSDSKNKDNNIINLNIIHNKFEDINNTKINRFSLISKSSNDNGVISLISNNQIYKSKSPMNRRNYTLKNLSNIYLKEISPFFAQHDINILNPNYKNDPNINCKNPLVSNNQKYSRLEKLKERGVEILKEQFCKDDNDNRKKTYNLDSKNDNNNLKDKKSLNVEIDTNNYIEIDKESEELEKEINTNANENINIIKPPKNKYRMNKSVLLSINYINNNTIFNTSLNDNYSHDIAQNQRINFSNKPSNKTLDYNKPAKDNLFAINEIKKKLRRRKSKQRKNSNPVSESNCNCKDILLVDDDEFILKTSKKILKNFKLEADSAENGEECLNLIKAKQEKNCNCSRGKYKIILMDITMPVMDGIEAAKNIQKLIDENKLYDTLKILFISAHINLDLSTILSGIKCAGDYYAKPISIDKYKSLLDKYYYSK